MFPKRDFTGKGRKIFSENIPETKPQRSGQGQVYSSDIKWTREYTNTRTHFPKLKKQINQIYYEKAFQRLYYEHITVNVV